MEKSAMTQLKERLEILSNEFGKSQLIPDIAHKKALDEVIKHIDSQMLAIEKEQLCEMYIKGRKDSPLDWYPEKHAKETYSQTFEK